MGLSGIYISRNTGATWTLSSGAGSWSAVAASADGSRFVATKRGLIITSNDAGATWTAVLNADRVWTSVASSADGSKIVAVAKWGDELWQTPDIYVSTDAGLT